MKNIAKTDIKALLTGNGFMMKATQPKLCVPVINRIYKKMKAGIYFPPVKADGDLLCDGHHRYIASLLSAKKIEQVPTIATSSTKVIMWSDIVFDEEDWDTEARIKMLNEQDALYNDMALQKLLDLLR